MLDEPLGALDRALRERLMLDVRAILKRIGMTAIYVTHDQTEAFAVSDRLAVMSAGHIEQVGPPQAVYARPATPFVAQFLGFRNLLPGRVRQDGIVETDAGLFRPDTPLPAPGAAVTLLIKPIAAYDTAPAPVAGPNRFEAVVDEITFRGRFSQVWLNVAGRRLLFEEPGDVPFHAGEAIHVSVSPDDLLVYETSP
jgi:ABC-type Fe3+/spermidine/putrescine transport system ATPase subunit